MIRVSKVLAIMAALLALALAGCSLSVPTDPDETLDRVRGGVLRVGISPYPPFTEITPDRDPTGIEPELVRGFADRINADIKWETGGESELIPRLQGNQLDLVIGGLDSTTPWSNAVGITRSYLTTVDADGHEIEHVMAIKNGENDFLFELEDYLTNTDVPVPGSVEVKQ